MLQFIKNNPFFVALTLISIIVCPFVLPYDLTLAVLTSIAISFISLVFDKFFINHTDTSNPQIALPEAQLVDFQPDERDLRISRLQAELNAARERVHHLETELDESHRHNPLQASLPPIQELRFGSNQTSTGILNPAFGNSLFNSGSTARYRESQETNSGGY